MTRATLCLDGKTARRFPVASDPQLLYMGAALGRATVTPRQATMSLQLYDTMSRSKRAFAPRDPQRVTMYVCGPTVYNFAHIGNFRPVVVFDLLFRVLRHAYG